MQMKQTEIRHTHPIPNIFPSMTKTLFDVWIEGIDIIEILGFVKGKDVKFFLN